MYTKHSHHSLSLSEEVFTTNSVHVSSVLRSGNEFKVHGKMVAR